MSNAMTNRQSSGPDFWASIRSRPRSDGTTGYAVLFRLDGKQRPITFDVEEHAKAFQFAVKAFGIHRALEMHDLDKSKRLQPGGDAAPLTVAQWCRRHIDNLTGVEQYTLDCYERYLKLDIVPILGDIPLSRLTEEDIAQWVKHLESTPRAKTGRVPTAKTIHNLHGFLSGALNTAVPKHIPANPAAGRRLPRTTREASEDEIDDDDEVQMLSREEFAALLDAMIEPYKPMLRFLVASGFRWGEVSALKPGDVDRKAGTVRVRRAWKYSSAGYRVGPPKTKRSKRTVNVPKDVLEALNYDGEWLFVNARGGPVRYPAFRAVWDRAVTKAKLGDVTPHCLRHTCGSWLLAAGEPLLNVSRHLGHESAAVTSDIYGHVNRASHQAIAETMSKLLGGAA
jgi:integrase